MAGSPLEHSWHSCFSSRHFGWLLCSKGSGWGEKAGCGYLGTLAGWEMLWDHEGLKEMTPWQPRTGTATSPEAIHRDGARGMQ